MRQILWFRKHLEQKLAMCWSFTKNRITWQNLLTWCEAEIVIQDLVNCFIKLVTFLKIVFWSITCTEPFGLSSFKSSQNILSILSMLFESSIFNCNTTQKTKISVMDFFSKCHQIHRKLRIWLHLLKQSLMENFIFLCNANFWVTNYIFEIHPAESLQTFEVFCPRCLLLY